MIDRVLGMLLDTEKISPLTTSPTEWSNTLKQLNSNELLECVGPLCRVGA